MCEKCDGERRFLSEMQALARLVEDDWEATRDLLIAMHCEERDQDISRHLLFLTDDSGQPVEELLLGALYLSVLEMKARLQ